MAEEYLPDPLRPTTRTSSRKAQYTKISTMSQSWMAQKCGHTISLSN
jgi:hypothetical protein